MGEQRPTSENELGARVQAWLESHGYPLEMRIARAFHNANVNEVVQSEYYETKNQSGQTIYREIDVAAQLALILHRPHPAVPSTNINMLVDFTFVVECKTSTKSRPWVVFSDMKTEPPERTFFWFHPASDHGHDLMRRLHQDGRLLSHEFFQPRRVGYAAACAFNESDNNDDRAYKALTGVLTAAKAKSSVVDPYYTIFRVVLPIVVITDPLFESYLDQTGQLKVESRDEMAIYWKNPWVGQKDSIVYVLTERALPRFIERAKEAFELVHACEREMLKTVKFLARDESHVAGKETGAGTDVPVDEGL